MASRQAEEKMEKIFPVPLVPLIKVVKVLQTKFPRIVCVVNRVHVPCHFFAVRQTMVVTHAGIHARVATAWTAVTLFHGL
jgi:hypothetical protein